ncbi:MAG: hydroxyacylglutathione hydrolase [Alphaproteobacteria bacterium]|nr:hydroxyacylglutathione hydrolase [Alphaproteobacteria bacterium]
MPVLEIELIPVMSDNYIALLHDPATGATAAVDPGVSEPVMDALTARGWGLTHILVTHHHTDHVGGIPALKAATSCWVVGAEADSRRIPGLDIAVNGGDTVVLGDAVAQVFAVPGHTSGHIAYWFPDSAALFCGDTLFSIGCGRLFEGTARQMWDSLCLLRQLPDDTRVYCAHEYTLANIKFALSIDPGNQVLRCRRDEAESLRARHLPTVPSTLAMERAANPFLRADTADLRHALGMPEGDPAQVFAAIRRAKDSF